ncbi:hypothetical protein FSP39_019026 [Pinctada imbricata]|uniref:Uncharacterized protein n=1 Tax=Pinctada imbricata TaxID=66713 RepID=A0AA89BSA5_PINIB|nr:hypothetical protein FSP39_019026 [Pinctada imbricata]
MTSYEKAADEVKRLSKERLQQLIQQFMKAHEIRLSEVDIRGRKDVTTIERKKQELKTNLEEVKAAVEKAKSAPVDASFFQIIDELSKVCSRAPGKIICPGKPSFTESNIKLSSHDILGSTNYGPKKILLNASTRDQYRDMVGTSLAPLIVEVKILKRINDINAQFMVHVPEEGVWIYNSCAKSIDVYNENFTRTKNSKIDFSCHGMELFGRKEILTMDRVNNRLMRLSSSGTITFLCNIDEYWCDICVNNKQQIVVGAMDEDDCDVEIFGWKLKLYSPDASSVLQETKEDNIFAGHNIAAIRQTVSGHYVVAIDERVICFSEDLQKKWRYKFETEYFVGTITSLCCDEYNNIIVGDSYKNEIVMLSIDGKRVGTLLTEQDGICKPLSMDVDGKGRLWIGQKENVLIASNLK